jgi:hypothetical protein
VLCQAGSIISSMASPRTVLRPFRFNDLPFVLVPELPADGRPTVAELVVSISRIGCGGMLVEQRRVTELGRVVGDLRDFRPFRTTRLSLLIVADTADLVADFRVVGSLL